MSAMVEFHFDFGSPNAYLSHLVIPAIEQRTWTISHEIYPVRAKIRQPERPHDPRAPVRAVPEERHHKGTKTQRLSC